MKDNEITEMAVSALAAFLIVFLAVIFAAGPAAAVRLAFFYAFLFYVPFLPLAYSFRMGGIERAVFSNILGLCYVGIYATLDIVFKVKLEFWTYTIVTLLVFASSCWIYLRKH